MKKALTFFLAVVLSGCAARVQHVTDIPNDANGKPVATEAQVKDWDAAIGNLHKMATTVSTLRQSVIALNKSGAFPDGAQYAVTLSIIGKIDRIELSSVDYLNSVPKTWPATTARTIQANMQNIVAQIQLLNSEGVTGIKNPESLSQINQLIGEVATLTNLVLSIGGA